MVKALALAAAAGAGCATLPRMLGTPSSHPCTSIYCRYFVAEGAAGTGHCALALRVQGGRP